MLKALELIGFKSFADKTRFEFPPGITAVVGPNGSGKSNIVDAIKWVLGEQRVKSLRGKEMADVIFNGSGTRRPLNTAEITITLDNSSRLLPVDTPEVHITRRVYRSGEGEYLINRQPCRLRDIRDLLSGTGLGTQAYSVIEQGKIDVLLQSSPRDRRVIFEEAAGISRFKAKRIEAERRLERVDQNLLRLSDIVDEVESRLRSVRLQATKARRYKQYVDRLQELRTQAGLVDWRRLSQRLAEYEAHLAELRAERDAVLARAEACEARLLETETRIGELNEAIRQSELRTASNRERIAAAESLIDHQRARLKDLEQEIVRHRGQLVALNLRAGDLEQQLRQTAEQVRSAADHHRRVARLVAEGERAVSELIERLDQLRSENHQRRTAYVDQMRAVAESSSRVAGLETRLAALRQNRERIQGRIARLDEQIQQLAAERQSLEDHRRVLVQRLGRVQQEVAGAEDQLRRLREDHACVQRELGQLENRAAAVSERIALMEELERRREGVSPGAKDLLALAAAAGPAPL
ncbi:MAG TPA: chromosome segregation protein SMC, partial [Planctomycetes bacterium]|nr:chromosome segregation protein SMC [Planctomycetota bacterium]